MSTIAASISPKLLELEASIKFGTRLCMGNDERARKKISPKVGVTLQLLEYDRT